jgi:long-chain-fatty-acid---luciferin-component ligase
MVELNTLLSECECGNKHIPVWLDVFALDMETYEVADNGVLGLLGFLDASARSFPAFIISGDLGYISFDDDCPCGRKGRCVKVVRRINTIDSRGCALKMSHRTQGA